MSTAKAFLGVFFLMFLITFGLLVPAIATGSLLRLVFPSVDRGMSILIGLVATVSAVSLIVKFSMDLPPGPFHVGNHALDDNGDEDEDEEDEDQDNESSRAPDRPPTWTLPTPERPSWKRRRKRR